VQNKEALLRVIDAEENHMEFKAFDSTANPYLGLAALVCAGMAGLATDAGVGRGGKGTDEGTDESREEEASKGETTGTASRVFGLPPPIRHDPRHVENVPRLPTGSYEELVKASLGSHIEEKLVRADEEGTMEHQWRESMRVYGSGDVDEAFQAFFEDFARVKMAEVGHFKGMSFEDEVELLLDRY